MRRWLQRHGAGAGLLGVIVVAVSVFVTALAYSGRDGEPYSPLNHTVSELGERGVSELAPLFNTGLVVGGVLVGLFMLGKVLNNERRAEMVFGVLGMLAAAAVMLVGLFPVDEFDAHKVAAILAFLSITVLAAWFVGWMVFGQPPYPRWLAGVAAWIVVAMVAFLVLPGLLQPDYTFNVEFDPDPPPRPDVWLAALLEWVVIGSTLAWIALLAWFDRARQRSADEPRTED